MNNAANSDDAGSQKYAGRENVVDVPRSSNIIGKPFLKWAGGKSQLLSELFARLPQSFERYYEPFVGGGAFYFRLQPQAATLNDVNAELMLTYHVVRDSVEELITALAKFHYDKDFYYEVRAWDRSPEFSHRTSVERAARLIFLNKTCFNGLYRVNSKGCFNVPFGKYVNPTILDGERLRACSRALQGALLLNGDFRRALEGVTSADFVYFDPPYVPLSRTANFTSYSADGFAEAEQRELAELCSELDQMKVRFMLSNADTPEARELYRRFHVEQVFAGRAINSKGHRRGSVGELIVRNYD